MFTTQEIADALMDFLEKETEVTTIKGFPLWSNRRLAPPVIAVILSGVEPEANYIVLGRGVTYYIYSVVCYGSNEHELEALVDKMIELFALSNVKVAEESYAYMTQAIRAQRTVDEDASNYAMEFILQILQGE